MFYKLNEKDVKRIVDIIIDNFKKNEAKINNLNVFPVPDGDTGTNMLLTLKSIREEVFKLKTYTLKGLAEKVSFGALMGARGNSGVILSQILKGFFDVVLSKEELNMEVIEEALRSSKDLSYSSVQNPTEGTMLTIIKDIHQVVENLKINEGDIDYEELLDNIIKEAEKSVIRTTYLLPVLKEADVVDAGAQGILDILIGFKKALIELGKINGKLKRKIKKESERVFAGSTTESDYVRVNSSTQYSNTNSDNGSDLKYTYCTEMIVKGKRIDVERFREDIESLGDSAMVVGDEKLVKIHVHTNKPHRVLKRALREGTLHDIQINNMVDQTKQAKILEREKKIERKIGLAAVANGSGFEKIFKSIGIDVVIKGGQSMNPSTYDLVKAIEKISAEKVIIFPNNKNVIPTAKQAKRIVKKDIIIIPTKTLPQGIAAVLNYNADLGLEENIYNMEKATQCVKSGEVTVAVRDANLLVGEIKKGAYIGLCDGNIRVISDNVVDAVIDLVRDMVTGKEEIITIYTGKDVKTENDNKIKSELEKYFPNLEIEFHKGDQPLYPYIFSIE